MAYLLVHVKANSKKDSVSKINNDLIVSVKEPPIDNRANIAVINLLSKYLKIPKTKIKLIKGASSKIKIFDI